MTPEEKSAMMNRIKLATTCAWMNYQEPFHVIGDIYYVGNKYVAYYLIKSEDRIVLIDCGWRLYHYQLIDSLHRIGVKPEEVTDLFISHGHFDHCGCAREFKEMSGCKIWFPKGDAFFLNERRDLIIHEDEVAEFEVDEYYDYDSEIIVGKTIIKPLLTPGHTPGTTSFLITTMENGQEVVCGFMGGLGLNGLEQFELEEKGLPVSLQQEYKNALHSLYALKIDVNLPSHPHVYPEFLEKVGKGAKAFIDQSAWQKMLEPKMAGIEIIISNNK